MLTDRLQQVLVLLGDDLSRCQIHVKFVQKGVPVSVEVVVAYVTHNLALLGENIPSERGRVSSDQELRLLIVFANVPHVTLARVAEVLGIDRQPFNSKRAIIDWVLEGTVGG